MIIPETSVEPTDDKTKKPQKQETPHQLETAAVALSVSSNTYTSTHAASKSKSLVLRYTFLDDGKRVAFHLPQQSEIDHLETLSQESGRPKPSRKTYSNLSLCIVLDVSGSMSESMRGSNKSILDQALDGVQHYLQSNLDEFSNVVLFRFSNSTSVVTLKNVMDVRNAVQGTYADGCTNFVSALQSVADAACRSQTDVLVWFLSDGYYTNSDEDFGGTISKLKAKFAERTRRISFHCVGFGEPAVEALTLVSKLGNVPGTYQFADSIDVFKDTCDKGLDSLIKSVIGSNRALLGNAPLVLHYGPRLKHLQVRFDEEITIVKLDEKLRNYLFQPDTADSSGIPNLAVGDKVVCELCIELKEVPSDFITLESAVKVTQDKLFKIASGISVKRYHTFIKPMTIDEARPKVDALDRELTAVTCDPRFFSLSGDDKRVIFEHVDRCKGIVSNLYSMFAMDIKNYKSELEKDSELALLITACYSHITRRGLQKTLDKRVLANRDLLGGLDVHKSRVFSTIDFTALEKVGSPSREFYQCQLTYSNWIELLLEKSALFLGIKMSRTQAAIVDPSQIKIHEFASTLLSADFFLKSLMFKMKNGVVDEQLHGGFARIQALGSVVTGQAREDINGCVPLYINAEHWKIARLVSMPIFGWCTALDCFGFNPIQQQMIPLMSLFRFLEMESASDFHTKLFYQILRTCYAVYQENKMSVPDYQDPKNRLPETQPSHRILLAKLLVDQHSYNLRQLMLWIIEEEVRRCMKAAYGFDDITMIETLARRLGCDQVVSINTSMPPQDLHKLPHDQKYVAQPVNVYNMNSLEGMLDRKCGKSLPPLRRFFLVFRATHGEVLQRDSFCAQIDADYGLPTDDQVRLFKNLLATCNSKGLKFTELVRLVLNGNLQGMRMPNVLQLNALVVQCCMQRRNNDRRDALSSPAPLLQPLVSVEDAEKIISDFVEMCRKQQINRIVSQCQAAYNEAYGWSGVSGNDFCKMLFRGCSPQVVEDAFKHGKWIRYYGHNTKLEVPVHDLEQPYCPPKTPLMIAIEKHDLPMIDLLLRVGADPAREVQPNSKPGRNAFWYAVRAFGMGRIESAAPLVQMLNIDQGACFHVSLKETKRDLVLDWLNKKLVVDFDPKDCDVVSQLVSTLQQFEVERLKKVAEAAAAKASQKRTNNKKK